MAPPGRFCPSRADPSALTSLVHGPSKVAKVTELLRPHLMETSALPFPRAPKRPLPSKAKERSEREAAAAAIRSFQSEFLGPEYQAWRKSSLDLKPFSIGAVFGLSLRFRSILVGGALGFFVGFALELVPLATAHFGSLFFTPRALLSARSESAAMQQQTAIRTETITKATSNSKVEKICKT